MWHDVVLSQRREWESIRARSYVARTSAPDPAAADLARVVIGPRRAGKSSYAAHLAVAEGVACGYLNFDDERIASPAGKAALDHLLAAVDAVYGNPPLLLLDEIQNLAGWELWVNRLQRCGRRLILTGSNAHLLGSELATHLTGRHLSIPLLPFSFAEFLAARGRVAGDLTSAELAAACRTHAATGGFPEVVLKDLSAHDYLRTLLGAVIHKDIVLRHGVRAPQALDTLARCLLSQPGGAYSFRTLRHATGCRSVHTMKKYVGYLEQAFLFFTVPRFSFKPREQSAAPKKCYAIDNGLAEAAGFMSSPGHGRLLENLVAIALHRRQLRGELQLFYWQDPQKSEVDFVIHQDRTVKSLVQVSATTNEPRTRARELRGLLNASRALGCTDLLVLTEEAGASTTIESWQGYSTEVRWQPVSRWLLDQA